MCGRRLGVLVGYLVGGAATGRNVTFWLERRLKPVVAEMTEKWKKVANHLPGVAAGVYPITLPSKD